MTLSLIRDVANGLGRQRFRYDSTDETIAIVAIVFGSLFGFLLVLQVLSHRRKMAELRFKSIEALAKSGQLTPERVEEYLNPAFRRMRFWVLLAWFALVGGIMLMIAGGMQGGRDAEEMILAGICVSIGATAVLAAPIVLRELRKEGFM